MEMAAIALEIERERDFASGDEARKRLGKALQSALETAANAYLLIPGAQSALRELADAETDPIRKAAREYQIDLVEMQLARASDLAQKRIEYFARIKTAADIANEKEKCKADILHFFEYYAWGFDPRPDSPLNTIPFGLFEFQERYVHWLDYLVFKTRQSGVVPKSRDMGATETSLRWATYHWLFSESFEVLLLSRTEDEVDSKNDVNTLFEKVRFQLRLLPEWMQPTGFNLDRDMPYMLIKNPDNQSTFHGRAPTENVGRQLRVAAVIYDEHAFAPNGGHKQHTALSQTTKSLIAISSVGGRLNKFADLVLDNKTPQFVMDWREHPWKDSRWYDALPTGVFGTAMTGQQIAQEVDRDLDASQPGKVWKFQEEYLFMTWREVVALYDKFHLGDKFRAANGRYKIPSDWRWSDYHDYGQTPGHEWAYLLAARPTEFYPLSDTIFVFVARNLEPTGLTTEQAVSLWRGYQFELGLADASGRFLHKPYDRRNSHEQKSLRETLMKEYGESWQPWDTDYIAGIEQMQTWFNVIDRNRPNPFRPELMGRARIIYVAPDDEYQLAFNEREGSYFVTNSKTEAGFMTARKQNSAYHYPEEERGKDVKKMRPAKQFDDICDVERALAVTWGVPAGKKTEEQEIESRLPEVLQQPSVMEHYGQDGFVEIILAKRAAENDIRMQMEDEREKREAALRRVVGSGRRVRLLGNRRR